MCNYTSPRSKGNVYHGSSIQIPCINILLYLSTCDFVTCNEESLEFVLWEFRNKFDRIIIFSSELNVA